MVRLHAFLAALAALVMNGCSHIDEKHYMVLLDQDKKPINYFKLDISGWTMLSSSRYVSGYFDESAVNTYFGTFTQPANGAFAKAATQPTTQKAQGADDGKPYEKATPSHLVPVADSGSNRVLVLLLSSNADAIADSLGALAQNSALAQDVVRIANRDVYAKQLTAQTSAAASGGAGDVVVANAATLLTGLTDDATPTTVEQNLVALSNQLSTLTAAPKTFASLDDIKTVKP